MQLSGTSLDIRYHYIMDPNYSLFFRHLSLKEDGKCLFIFTYSPLHIHSCTRITTIFIIGRFLWFWFCDFFL